MPSRPERVDSSVEQSIAPTDRSKGRPAGRSRAEDVAVEISVGRDNAVPDLRTVPERPPRRSGRGPGALLPRRRAAAARGHGELAIALGTRPRAEGRVVALVDPPHPAAWGLELKRVFDVVFASLALVLVAPLLLLLAIAIRIDSPGQVLFSQPRVGRGGKLFACYKLRTMCKDAEARLHADPLLRAAYLANHFKLPSASDARVTRLGRFLRVSSLDELPQLWNVIRGDMSLVGPRPIVAQELFQYGAADRAVLLSMRPGITGAWAVAGRSRIVYPRRAAIEVAYVRAWSLRRDAMILLKTVSAVMQRRGAT